MSNSKIQFKEISFNAILKAVQTMNYRHCLDGPAIIRPNGTKEWWVNGNLHCLDGPAVVYADGTKEWWAKGKVYSFDIWCGLSLCSDEELVMMKLSN